MWSKLQWRYFFILLIPSIVILLLGMGLTFYSHRHAMETMRRDMETARQQTIEIVSSGVDTLFKQASMTAVNLSFQIDAMQNNNPITADIIGIVGLTCKNGEYDMYSKNYPLTDLGKMLEMALKRKDEIEYKSGDYNDRLKKQM